MIKTARSTIIFFLAFLYGCQVGPRYHPPETKAPEQWKHPTQETDTVACVDNWWEIFNDPRLNELEEYAIENNVNLFVVMDKVAQARAQVGIARADLFPQLNIQPVYNNQATFDKLFLPSSSSSKAAKVNPYLREHALQYWLPLNLSYEVDLWGMIRDQYYSAIYNYEALEQQYLSALLILTSDVASTYFQIRALDTLTDLYKETIVTRKKAYQINLDRYKYKIIDNLAVAQSGLDLSNVESLYSDTIRQRELEVDALATLLGIPASEFCIEPMSLLDLPPVVPAGIPSDVLLQRPDIAEAERTMASEHALIDSAVANFFPSVVLTGGLGYESPDLKNFLQWISRYWQLGANINQTFFDGGRKASQLELAWANFMQAGDTYQQTVLVAFQEVEDALANLEWLAKESISVQKSVNFAKDAYQISMDRYLRGVDFYLQVVDNERQLLDNQRALTGILEQQYIATIQLIKALGGSWSLE